MKPLISKSTARMNVRRFMNGKLVASETPKCQNVVTSACDLVDQENRSPNVQAQTLPSLISGRRFLVLSLPHCPQCDDLKAALASRGVPNESVFIKWEKSDPLYPELKKQLSEFAGETFAFPQVFAEGAYQGGFKEVLAKLTAGKFDDLFEDEFGVAPSTVQRIVDSKPMVVFSLPECPQCDVLRENLAERGIPVADVFVKWNKADSEYQSLKSQIMKMMGKQQFAFPQTFISGVYQGDYDEVISKADAGQYADFFADTFGIKPPAPVETEVPVGAVAFDEDF